jgi:serine/threonine-protein kinase
MTSPNQIGRFEVQKALGKGSQGIVYLARDPRLDPRVAIKTIRCSMVHQPGRHLVLQGFR